MKIYTKMGDDGTTGTYQGCRVNKDTPLMEAIGTVDELNSVLGMVISFAPRNSSFKKITDSLREIQEDLFAIGAMLAGDKKNLQFTPRFHSGQVIYPSVSLGTGNLQKRTKELEEQIDEMWKKLPALKNFILPGGTNLAATLFFARAVCRRAERRVVSLKKYPEIVQYLNRLSNYLFVLGRYVNFLEKEKEIVWKR